MSSSIQYISVIILGCEKLLFSDKIYIANLIVKKIINFNVILTFLWKLIDLDLKFIRKFYNFKKDYFQLLYKSFLNLKNVIIIAFEYKANSRQLIIMSWIR